MITIAGTVRAVGVVTTHPDSCVVLPNVFGDTEVTPGQWVHLLAGWFWSPK